MREADISAVVVIAMRHRAVLSGPESNRRPFCHSSQVEAGSLRLASLPCLVESHIHLRVSVSQGVCPSIDDYILILGVVEAILLYLCAVDRNAERRMNVLTQSGHKLAVLQLIDGYIHRRDAEVIQQDDILPSGNLLYCRCKLIVICHNIFASLNRIQFQSNICHTERNRLLRGDGFPARFIFRIIVGVLLGMLGIFPGRNFNLSRILHSESGSHHAILVDADVNADIKITLQLLHVQHKLVIERDLRLADRIRNFRSFIYFDYIHRLLPPFLRASS